jgi:AcrR family transcriptional regulator
MARPAKFTEDLILNAASEIVAADGPGGATIAAIGHALGAPSGSIYHRFRTRDELLGRLWLSKAAYFQDNFVNALAHPDAIQAARDAALSLPHSVRLDLTGACIMLLYRREDFLSDNWPPEMKAGATRLGRQVESAIEAITRRLFGNSRQASKLTTTFAVLDVPFAAVHRHVRHHELPPPTVDQLITTAVDAILVGAGSRSAK